MPTKINPLWDKLYKIGDECYQKEMYTEEIRDRLLLESNDEELIYAVIKKIKADHYAERAKEGKRALVIGLILIFVGFLITIINFHSNSPFAAAMYGFTIVGLSFVFFALYKFFS